MRDVRIQPKLMIEWYDTYLCIRRVLRVEPIEVYWKKNTRIK